MNIDNADSDSQPDLVIARNNPETKDNDADGDEENISDSSIELQKNTDMTDKIVNDFIIPACKQEDRDKHAGR